METKYIDLGPISKLISNNNVVLLALLQDLIKGSRAKHQDLVRNLNEGSWNSIKGNAHFLKSNFRHLGNTKYAEMLKSIEENALIENQHEKVRTQILDFDSNFETIMNEVEAYIEFLKSSL